METSSAAMRNLVDIILAKKELRDKRIAEITKNLSEHQNYIKKERTGKNFKKDITATIIQKKFIRNGGSDLKHFLESRCQTPQTKISHKEFDQASKGASSLILEKPEIPVSLNELGDKTNREISLFNSHREYRSPNKKNLKYDDQNSTLNLSPTQVPISRFSLKDTELDLLDMKSEKDVDKIPSIARIENRRYQRELKPGSMVLKTPSKSTNGSQGEGLVLNYLRQKIVTGLENSKNAISSIAEKANSTRNSPLKKRKAQLEQTEYLSSRERPPTPHYLSTHLEYHLKRKNLYLTTGLLIKTPQFSDNKSPTNPFLKLSPPNKTSIILNKTLGLNSHPPTPTNLLSTSKKSGNWVQESKHHITKSLGASMNSSMTRNRINQSESKMDSKDLSNESLSARDVGRKSKLFNQALRDTYGKRLYKLSKTFMLRNEA